MKTYFLRRKEKLLLFVLYLLSLTGCMVMEVHANESLSIKEVIVGVRSTQKKELKKYSIYQPHSTFLFIPIKKWLYQFGEKHFYPEKIQAKIIRINRVYQNKIDQAVNEKDKIKLVAQRDRLIKSKERALAHGNRFMRMGEKPMAYNRIYVQQNEKIFLDYLHSKGYLDAVITTQTDFKKNSVCVTYRIQQGHAYKISSIELDIKDPSIKEILLKHVKESFIKKNNPYQYQDFINEQERIITLLSNNGYFEFNEEYCHFTAEVSQNDHTIAITTVIDKPDNKLIHNKIKVGRVIVDLTPKNKTKGQTTLLTKEYQGIVFLIESDKHLLKDLVHKIAIRPGDFYDKSKILETSERLHRLGIFESITILPKKEADHLVIYIYLKPYERVIVQTEIGGECINLNLKRLRPTIKIIPTIRQLFGGLGIVQIETNVSLSEQLTGKKQAFYKHLSGGLRLKYTTPHFLLPLSERVKVVLEDFSPNTAVHIGFNYIRNPIYTRKKIDSELIYDWRHRDKNISYQFSPCKISYIHPRVIDKNAYKNDQYQLEKNILIPSFLTSIGFVSTIKDATSNEYLDVLNRYKWIFSIGVEHGGLYEKIFSLKKIFPRKFQFYQYIKFDLDHRRSFNLAEDTMVVCQTKLGVNIAYGENDIAHPDKQYQAGGYSGVRAWDTHKIGPGYCQCKKNKIREGNGDLLLLGNIELRQKLIGFLEGALFVDIGNTWSLSRNAPMEAKFDFNNFYKAFAIGGGFGLRLNFYNTFVLCGDVAIKLRSPSGLISQSKLVNFNLTIGYPF